MKAWIQALDPNRATTTQFKAQSLSGSAEFPGDAESAGRARQWAHGLLARRVDDQVLDDVLVLVSELVTNSIVHSHSGSKPGGSVTVYVATEAGSVYVEVIDDGSDTSVPTVRETTADSDGGRGLWMVNAIAAGWGIHHDKAGNTVWFHVGKALNLARPTLSPSVGNGDW